MSICERLWVFMSVCNMRFCVLVVVRTFALAEIVGAFVGLVGVSVAWACARLWAPLLGF